MNKLKHLLKTFLLGLVFMNFAAYADHSVCIINNSNTNVKININGGDHYYAAKIGDQNRCVSVKPGSGFYFDFYIDYKGEYKPVIRRYFYNPVIGSGGWYIRPPMGSDGWGMAPPNEKPCPYNVCITFQPEVNKTLWRVVIDDLG